MVLTSLKGERQEFPSSRIMEVKKVPDTLIVMSNGNCLMVKESVDDVIKLFMIDRRRPFPLSLPLPLVSAFA